MRSINAPHHPMANPAVVESAVTDEVDPDGCAARIQRDWGFSPLTQHRAPATVDLAAVPRSLTRRAGRAAERRISHPGCDKESQ